MTPKDTLKCFLKKEVKRYKSRIQKSSPSSLNRLQHLPSSLILPSTKPSKINTPSSPLFTGNTSPKQQSLPLPEPRKSTPDSRFGDSVFTNETDEISTSKTTKVPFASISMKFQPSLSSKTSQADEIDALKKELEAVLERELKSNDKKEKKSLAVRRAELVSKISRLERAGREARAKKIKAPFEEPFKNLPEPVTPEEKKKLMNEASQVAKARLAPVKSSPKRNREEDDVEDDDLDGEERLRMGKKLKPTTIKVTGHWGSEIHNYMPESQINTEEYNLLKSMSTEEKKVKRKDIIIYLKNAAEADRRIKKEKKMVEDEESLWV